MKKEIVLLLLFTCLFSCTKKEDDLVLTRINNDGTGGISCLVNGEVLVEQSKSNSIFSMYRSGERLYIRDDDNGIWSLEIGLYNSKYNKSSDIHIYDIEYRDKETYIRNSLQGTIFKLGEFVEWYTSSYGEYEESNPVDRTFTTTKTINGELEVTYHDVEKRILSGTFWYDAINDEGKVVEIRDGRFDMKINQ